MCLFLPLTDEFSLWFFLLVVWEKFIAVPQFLFMHQRHMSDKKKREIFANHSRLLKLKEKAKEEQKFHQRISTDLLKVIEQQL